MYRPPSYSTHAAADNFPSSGADDARPLSHRHALGYPSMTTSPCTIHEILRLRPDLGRLRLRRVLAAIAFPPPAVFVRLFLVVLLAVLGRLRLRRVLAAIAFPPPAAIARQTHEALHAVLGPQPAPSNAASGN